MIVQNYADWETNLTKVQSEYDAARKAIDSFPLMDDPWWGETSWQTSFTRVWNKRYGPGHMSSKEMFGIDNMIEEPVPMGVFNLKAKDKRIIAHLNFEFWYESIKDVVLKAV